MLKPGLDPATGDWTRPRHKSCGTGQHNSWLRWILMRCHYWHHESMSSMLCKISSSSLTASCQFWHSFSRMSYCSGCSSGSCIRLSMSVWGCCQNPDPGFHQYSAGLLQLILHMVCWAACNRFRTLQHISSPESGGASTSCQPYVSCTGCQSTAEWISESTLVCRLLAGTAPVYLADECMLVTAAGCCPLRSADNWTCLVKRSCNQFGGPCFDTAGPTLWNSLPELQEPDITFRQFKLSQKTFMFG